MADGRTLAVFNRPGYSLLTYPGLAWLRDVRWPVGQAVLDGEVCGETTVSTQSLI